MVEICLATDREASKIGPCCSSRFLSVLLPCYLHNQRIWPITTRRMGVTGKNSICDSKDYNQLIIHSSGRLRKEKQNQHVTQTPRHTEGCDVGALQKAGLYLSRAYYLGFSMSPNKSEPLPPESLGYLAASAWRQLKCFCIQDTPLFCSQDNKESTPLIK